MKMKLCLTQERLKELLIYAPETGRFYWRKQHGPVNAGSEAGNVRSTGYRLIGIDKHYHYEASARMALCIRRASDRRHRSRQWKSRRQSHCNLAGIAPQQNAHRARRRRNPSGFRGVSRSSPGRWRARIALDGKRVSLGSYKTPEEAARAYDEAAREYYGEFAMTNAELFGLKPQRNRRSPASTAKRCVKRQAPTRSGRTSKYRERRVRIALPPSRVSCAQQSPGCPQGIRAIITERHPPA